MRIPVAIALAILAAACDRPNRAPDVLTPAGNTAASPSAASQPVAPASAVTATAGSRPAAPVKAVSAPRATGSAANVRAGGTTTGGSSTAPARSTALPDEPCLGLRDQALDDCLTREIEAEVGGTQKAGNPALREFEQAQRERDRQLLEDEAAVPFGNGADSRDGEQLREGDEGQYADEEPDEEVRAALARQRLWERERARLAAEENEAGAWPPEEDPDFRYQDGDQVIHEGDPRFEEPPPDDYVEDDYRR